MEAFTRGLPVAIPDLRTDPRFDQIAFALRSAGIRGALSVPVEVLGGPIGTLDLFTVIPRAWDDSEVAAAHAYAGVVASLARVGGGRPCQQPAGHPAPDSAGLAGADRTGQGGLMASEKVDAQTAFDRLRRQARSTSRPLLEVAGEVIDGVWSSAKHRRPAEPGQVEVLAREG